MTQWHVFYADLRIIGFMIKNKSKLISIAMPYRI